MEIFINGNKLDATLEQETNLGEVLGAVEAECEKAGMTVTEVVVDGTPVAAADMDALFAKEPRDVGRIELNAISRDGLRDMMKALGDELSSFAPRLVDIPLQLQTGKDIEAMRTINGFSERLQDLYRLLPLLHLAGFAPGEPRVDGIALDAYPQELAPILTDLLEAFRKKDTVLAGDLSEYELAPRISSMGAALSAI
jgi:hypothetical protein